jgi:hypothetical protein
MMTDAVRDEGKSNYIILFGDGFELDNGVHYILERL